MPTKSANTSIAKTAVKRKAPVNNTASKRIYFKQTDFPLLPLQEAQKIASALINEFGGREAPPPDIALAVEISPTSSTWGKIAGSSIAYGLTEGGINAATIKLTELGRKLVAPESEGEDVAARREAALKPRICKDFFEKYNRAKFPSEQIGGNVLRSLGIPQDRAKDALELVKQNGKYAGIIRTTSTGLFVTLDSPVIPSPAVSHELSEPEETFPLSTSAEGSSTEAPASPMSFTTITANRVFISHGRQKAIVSQLQELLRFGNFEPVVSVERETTAVPVPEKVFEDMRSCAAGVIHVGPEGKYLDGNGTEHGKINDNVLIEIGAAMALYGKKVILLVERGVLLPSNLQGLYRCEFEGEKLDYDSTMKLLKTFSQFR